MLDEQDRELQVVPHLADEADELQRLLRVHPGGGLVEEQELGLRRERTRDLEAPLIAVREVACVVVVTAGEPAVVEQLGGALVRLPLFALHPRRSQDAPDDPSLQAAVHPDEHVLERRHLLKERMFWNVLPMPRSVAVCGGEPAMSLPSKTTRPEVGL